MYTTSASETVLSTFSSSEHWKTHTFNYWSFMWVARRNTIVVPNTYSNNNSDEFFFKFRKSVTQPYRLDMLTFSAADWSSTFRAVSTDWIFSFSSARSLSTLVLAEVSESSSRESCTSRTVQWMWEKTVYITDPPHQQDQVTRARWSTNYEDLIYLIVSSRRNDILVDLVSLVNKGSQLVNLSLDAVASFLRDVLKMKTRRELWIWNLTVKLLSNSTLFDGQQTYRNDGKVQTAVDDNSQEQDKEEQGGEKRLAEHVHAVEFVGHLWKIQDTWGYRYRDTLVLVFINQNQT